MPPQPPTDIFAHAVTRHKSGDLDGAEAGYRRILRVEPGHADSLHLLGVVEHQRGRHEEAVESIGKAIALAPRRADYRNNLGIALKGLGQLDEAVAAYIEALRLNPAYADARSNLGLALHLLGQHDRARASFEAALRLFPGHPDALFNLGNLLREGGDAPGAISAYRASLRSAPGRYHALANLGQALLDCGRAEEAVYYFRLAAPLDPAATGRDATTSVPPVPPDFWAIRIAAACPTIFPDVAAIDRYRDGLEAALDAHPQGVRLPPGGATSSGCHAPSFQLAHQGRDDRALKAKFAAAFAGNFHDLHVRPGDAPFRIGFVANDPHEWGFLRCTGGIADRLDPGRFRVVILGTPRAMPGLRAGIRRPDAEFVDIPARLPEAAEAIAATRCDVLYHWQVGTDPLNYFLPFTRPVPVQCTSWGTHGTSGIPAMDYYLSADSIEAPEADAHYTETLVRMAALPTYQARVPSPAPPARRAEFGLPEGMNLYACLQRLLKFHPDFDAILADILRRDPRGLVLLRAEEDGEAAGLLKSRMAATIADVSDRVLILPRGGLARYHRLLSLADVVLDPIPFGGGMTAYDAFSFGLPTVTLPGRFGVGRFALACYRRLGIGDLVAESPGHYAELATRLGMDRAYRRDIAGRIAAASPVLFEDMEAVREHGRFFEWAASLARAEATSRMS